MEIRVLEPYGYCAGVASAMEIAKKTKLDNPNKNVVVLGMLIHNLDALKELEELGIKTIYKDGVSLLDLIDEIDNKSIVILTAHGHAMEVEQRLEAKKIAFIDATCPFVTHGLKLIKDAAKGGHDIIYIGKKNHPESNAALSVSNKVHLVELNKPLDLSLIKDEAPLVISQTTFSSLEIERLVEEIKKLIPNANVINGVCNASNKRQEALLNAPKDTELIYVVGGINSNNTKTLFKMAESHFPNAKVLAIQNDKDINKKDLLGLSRIVISSGASTPQYIVEAIKSKIESLCD